MKRAAGESFQEYSTRIEVKMSKAFPGMQNTEIYTSLSIEHMLNGIGDQSIPYDVLTKRPQTLQEAVSLLSWHSSCKNRIGAIPHIRQVHAEEEEPCTPEIKRVENKQFVTEDRLDTFGRELTRSITSTMREIQKDIQNYVDQKVGHTLAKSSFVSYGCGEEEHTTGKPALFRMPEQILKSIRTKREAIPGMFRKQKRNL
jgi:hypothetical protein